MNEVSRDEKINARRNTGLDIRIFRTLLICNLIPILVVTAIFGCLGFGISRLKRTTTYTARASIIVNSPDGVDQPGVSAPSQADAVEAVLTNGKIMNPTLSGLKNKSALLQSLKVSASKKDGSSGYTHVLNLSIQSNDQKTAKKALSKIEKSAVQVLPENLNSVSAVQISPVKISESTTPSGVKYGAAFAIVGLLLSVLYVLIRELSNTSYHSRDVLSYETGVPVLGVIPNVRLVEKIESRKEQNNEFL